MQTRAFSISHGTYGIYIYIRIILSYFGGSRTMKNRQIQDSDSDSGI